MGRRYASVLPAPVSLPMIMSFLARISGRERAWMCVDVGLFARVRAVVSQGERGPRVGEEKGI